MQTEKLSKLVTEGRNPDTLALDQVSTIEMVKLFNEQDQKVALAVAEARESIAAAIDVIAAKLANGGRLIYTGAGTSGRLGILDASECPPTFGVDYELVQGLIAGGTGAIFKAVEGAEDDPDLGRKDLIGKQLTSRDVVCGIAASGRTPYVIGGMSYAREIGATVLCLTMNPESEMAKLAEVPIIVVVGPEAIMGSTRMKAGTAQKMVLNMLTTGAMVKLGRVYSNLMVDVKATNEKLVYRAKRIVMLATGVDEAAATAVLNETKYDVKLGILMLKTGLDQQQAKEILDSYHGYIQKAIDHVTGDRLK